jgi:hypothetical protein
MTIQAGTMPFDATRFIAHIVRNAADPRQPDPKHETRNPNRIVTTKYKQLPDRRTEV